MYTLAKRELDASVEDLVVFASEAEPSCQDSVLQHYSDRFGLKMILKIKRWWIFILM
jgi:hypothetical protein